MFSPETTESFWAKVKIGTDEECWIWMASCYRQKGKDTYGNFKMSRPDARRLGMSRSQGSNRMVWMLRHGHIPSGLQVLHRCPVANDKKCVNPRHLYLGTDSDNGHDRRVRGECARGNDNGSRKYPERLQRGAAKSATMKIVAARGDEHGLRKHPERAPMGERNGMAKLTATSVLAIRSALENGSTEHDLASEFNVVPQTIHKIRRRERWRHL